MSRILLSAALLLVPSAAASSGGAADDLSGRWSTPGGTRLDFRLLSEGRHLVTGAWRGKQVEGYAVTRRLPGGEAGLSLRLAAGGEKIQGVWRLARDRTRMTRGNAELEREVPAGSIRLKLMTYNIKGVWHLGRLRERKIDGPGPFDFEVPEFDVNDMKGLSRYLREEQPDLVALQEVERVALPTVDDQAETAAKEAGYVSRYAAASFSGKNLPGPVDVGWEHGNAVLVRRGPGLRIEADHHYPLPQGFEGEEKRVALAVDLTAQGLPLQFISTHLMHNSAATRKLQAGRVAELFSKPTLLLGDLNAKPGAPELGPLGKRCQDAFEEGYAGGAASSIGDLSGNGRIDFILLCGTGGRVLSSWIAGYHGDALDGFSDHRAVLAVIELPAKRSK